MSIKIHHGPNGSYKTSGAIQDDAVPALREGRLIITNVRGFTLENAFKVYPDLPESTQIINLSLESLADIDRMRTWFQWAPRGAFVIFDETQLVFPKTWREKDLDRFDFPGGPEAAQAADRPMSWLDAWTRHRHWNWDVVLTTPNISYIRDDIRMTCEMAYLHKNLAVIGIGGRYREAQHDAQVNRPPVEGTVVEFRKIKPETFRLYQSTATGKVTDTKAGKSFLRSPKLIFMLVLIAGLLSLTLSFGGIELGPAKAVEQPLQPDAVDSPASLESPAISPLSGAAVPGNPVAHKQGDLSVDRAVSAPAAKTHPLSPRTFQVRAVLSNDRKSVGYLDALNDDGTAVVQSLEDLRKLGYQVRIKNPCFVELTHPLGLRDVAVCPGRKAPELSSGLTVADDKASAPPVVPAAQQLNLTADQLTQLLAGAKKE